ncbi:hypothetical protein F0562_028991 [Nyssa sinensis]|uniref:FAS1 domain-containing protein n=1 Tax=Nyssa sinensis TaxID=561372 RepID=A0A5J5B3R1_9ASTE|nr:hypothetical protein F0562_028991 [Nyssa sinensis]
MALHFCSLSVKILTLFVIILLFLPRAVTAIPELELESMLAAVRTRGYNLFCNAITTSDIYYEVLAGTSFTFFAPTDASLFALDMIATSSDYITTLRFHVVPRRFSLSDLRTLPPGSSLHTLVPLHDISIERLPSLGFDIITANGINVVVPGLFYGRDIAVHGLGGILSFRSQIGQRQDSPPPPSEANFSGNHSSVVGDSHAPPPENSSSFDRFAQRQDSPPPPSEANFSAWSG